MEIRLLGAVDLVSAGGQVPLGPAKQRALLAALAVDAGRPVSSATLIDRIWDDSTPADARNVLHTYVARVRGVLARAQEGTEAVVRLERRSDGYQLVADPDVVDLQRFRAAVERSRALDPTAPGRAAVLREGLDLWRGDPLGGVAGSWAERVRQTLRQQRLDAVADWAGAELAGGHHDMVIERLRELVLENPLAEELTAHLLRALEAAGRHPEALDIYAKARQRIAEEIGSEPGPALQALYQRVLRHRPPAPATQSTVVTAPRPGPPGPAQLPRDIAGFAGRRADLERLDTATAQLASQPTAVVICGLWGTAGVGKTTLAVHWAQRSRDRFPDGQLYVDLRGFDPAGSPMSPAEAVRGFLDALAVPPQRMPSGVEAQAALYRSLIAHRRMMVLLDNARDADQVRPLLPGAPGCLVLVTSRNQLMSLVATEGLQPITLDLLTQAEARQLLALRVGAARVAAEPEAVDRLIARGARLPLALAIIAARAMIDPDRALAALADDLSVCTTGLDPLDPGDAASDLRRVFSWSYRTLSEPAARLFRLLGLHPGRDMPEPSAASLAGLPLAEVRPLLAELTRANLVDRLPGLRYRYHDLLRAYAAELALTVEPVEEQRAAQRRMLDHYLGTAVGAAQRIQVGRQTVDLVTPASGVTVQPLADAAEAMAWFTAERAALTAMVRDAGGAGFDAHVWQLAWSMRDYLDRAQLADDQVATGEAGLAAAERLGDRAAQADAHRSMVRMHTVAGRHDAATRHAEAAVALYADLGDHVGLARMHMSLGVLAIRQGDQPRSLGHNREALTLFALAEHAQGQANAHNNIASNLLEFGDGDGALHHGQQALALARECGDRWGEAGIQDSLAHAYLTLGQPERAVPHARYALDLMRQLGDRYHEAMALCRLAEAVGDRDEAAAALSTAADILEELGHDEALSVRARAMAMPGLTSGGTSRPGR